MRGYSSYPLYLQGTAILIPRKMIPDICKAASTLYKRHVTACNPRGTAEVACCFLAQLPPPTCSSVDQYCCGYNFMLSHWPWSVMVLGHLTATWTGAWLARDSALLVLLVLRVMQMRRNRLAPGRVLPSENYRGRKPRILAIRGSGCGTVEWRLNQFTCVHTVGPSIVLLLSNRILDQPERNLGHGCLLAMISRPFACVA
jgi:hypothetical protein